MSTEIIVPRLGWSMDEGAFCRWLKQEGELVREGDELFELEGDKSTQVVESFDAGVLHIGADGPKPGDSVKVGQVLGHLHPTKPAAAAKTQASTAPTEADRTTWEGEAPAEPSRSPERLSGSFALPVVGMSPSARRLARQLKADLQSPTAGNRHPGRSRRAATPRAARVAAELGVSTQGLSGTGKGGRIRERDVRSAAGAVGSPISATRRVIAERMLAASQQAAPVTLMARADASELVRFREECKRTQSDRGLRTPSYTGLFVKLSATALEKHPNCLVQWIGDSIVVPDRIDVSVAIDTPQGLVTPVVRDVPSLSLREVSNQLAELIELARSRRLAPEQMRGGVFTVSSLGAHRVEAFTPILNPPQTAILGVGRIDSTPVIREGRVVVRQMVALSLTFDHRVVDGAPAAALLTALCEVIENPLPWLGN